MGTDQSWKGRESHPGISRKLLTEAFDEFFRGGLRECSVHALEIGCGDGRLSELLFQRMIRCGNESARLSILDNSMKSIAGASRRLREEPGIRVVQGDLYRLPFSASSFDYLVALNVFYWADRKRLLAEAARVLKSGGKMLSYDVLPKPSRTHRPLISFVLSREQIIGCPIG